MKYFCLWLIYKKGTVTISHISGDFQHRGNTAQETAGSYLEGGDPTSVCIQCTVFCLTGRHTNIRIFSEFWLIILLSLENSVQLVKFACADCTYNFVFQPFLWIASSNPALREVHNTPVSSSAAVERFFLWTKPFWLMTIADCPLLVNLLAEWIFMMIADAVRYRL